MTLYINRWQFNGMRQFITQSNFEIMHSLEGVFTAGFVHNAN